MSYSAEEKRRAVELDSEAVMPESDSVKEDPASFTVPTKRQPTAEEMDELLFAWKACKSVKSNAILIAKNHSTVGAGQPNRVNSRWLSLLAA